MSNEYEYLDREGLNKLVQKIKDTYTTKVSTEDKESALYRYIDAETSRAEGRENDIESYAQDERDRIEGLLENEISRADEEEKRIDSTSQERDTAISETLSTEIELSRTKEGELTAEDTRLQGEIDVLESSKVAGVLVNGIDVVRNNVANIVIDKIVQASIQMVDELPDPEDIEPLNRPQNNVLYILRSNHVIYQWNETEYVEAGKFNVLLVDELPEIGDPQVLYIKSDDHSINIYTGNGNYQGITGRDLELRDEFNDFKTNHPDFHVEWTDVDNKPETYTPAEHIHDGRYYTKSEVDGMISEGAVSHQDLEDHINNSNPHPNFESRIDEKIAVKASTQMVMTHINNTSNPHAVSKEQIGLGNVDNTSDLEKPISLYTQAALDTKADQSWTVEELANRLRPEDVVDNLYTSQSEKPLSAQQGVVLDTKIQDLDTTVQSLGAALVFKGTVESREYLDIISNPRQGDSYQINSGEEGEDDGAMYAWDGNAWVQIVASATDLTSLIATDADVHSIIDEYN